VQTSPATVAPSQTIPAPEKPVALPATPTAKTAPAATQATVTATQPQPAVAPQIPPRPTASAADAHFGLLTKEHFARFAAWQTNASAEHFFIQLLATDAGSSVEIESFLARATKLLNPDELRAYRSSLSGRDRVGVIYGDYPTRQAASVAMRNLPEAIRMAHPYPRQVSKLQQ
jgi:septal ring-binding cell division protein DamX